MRYILITIKEENIETDDKIKSYVKTSIEFYGLKNILDSNSIVIQHDDSKTKNKN